jgi:hypothetical protein
MAFISRSAFEVQGPYSAMTLDSTADTALAALTTSSTIGDALTVLNALVARKRVTTRTSIGLATAARTKGAIATMSGIVTITAGTASQTGETCTGRYTDATFTCDTDADGDLTAINITAGGTNHSVGDRIMFDFIGSGVGYADVATVA